MQLDRALSVEKSLGIHYSGEKFSDFPLGMKAISSIITDHGFSAEERGGSQGGPEVQHGAEEEKEGADGASEEQGY